MISLTADGSRFRRRNLPHWEVNGGTYFITFRLAGSLPSHLEHEWREQREHLVSASASQLTVDERRAAGRVMAAKFDAQLDLAEAGPTLLRAPEIASGIRCCSR